MNETENADLKKEISRLNQIITVLLKQNDMLEKENSYLKTGAATSGLSFSNPKTGVGVPDSGISNPKIMVGDSGFGNSNDKIWAGNTDIGNSNDKIVVGNTGIWNSDPKTWEGNTGVWNPNPKTEVGKTENTVDIPALIPAEGVNVSILSQKLKRAGFLTVNRDGLRTASILLLHFYNKGKGDYPTLRKLTGLSEGGLAKAIMALKKRGLIHRPAYREFGLSAAALEVIRAAFAQ